MTQTKKSRIIRKKGQETDLGNSDMKTITTTKKLCSLQIQRQISINENYDMDSNEMFVDFLTEEELDQKIKHVIESNRFLEYQKRKIRRFFQHVKKTGWFQRFEYKGYQCAVEFDDLGRWRVFFMPKQGEHRSPLFDHDCNCDCCCYYMNNSSRFSLDGYPLGLWDYGEKIGLDDFIGLPTFSESEWQFDFFLWKKRFRDKNFADKIGNRLVDIQYAIKLNRKLVDCWIRYQKKKNRRWKCSLCTMEFKIDDLINERKKRHEEWHSNCKLQKRNTTEGSVRWEVVE